MDEDRFNMALRKFLKEVGVTSQREVEKLGREHAGQGDALRLRMVLTSLDSPALNHVVEQTIPLTSAGGRSGPARNGPSGSCRTRHRRKPVAP